MKVSEKMNVDEQSNPSKPKPQARQMEDGVSIVIPAYNEQEGIELVLQQLTDIQRDSDRSIEIVVVDDGSQDQTVAIAENYDGVRVLRHTCNRGYGAALKTGVRHSRYDLIVITDADGTYPNERIPELVDAICERNLDMVVAARVGENVSIPLLRRPAKWMLGKLATYVADTPIPDLNSGLRVFSRAAMMSFFGMLPEGFSFTTTITLAMLTNGYLVDYIPIDYHVRIGNSKIRPVRDTLNFLQLVFRIALYFAPLKIFLPLSGVILLLGLVWAATSAIVLGRLADASAAVIIMSAVQIGVLGLLAELMNRRLPRFSKSEESDGR
jgi:glycosyltransferase involved in cell wall biosynthesis